MKRIKLFGLALALAGLLSPSVRVFAANPYGISYTGGEPLGANNVTIDPTLVNGLTPLIVGSRSITYSNSSRWEQGYAFGGCVKSNYFTVNKNNPINANSGLSMTMSKDQYTANVEFTNVVIDDIAGTWGDKDVAVLIAPGDGGVHMGWGIYSDSSCSGTTSYGFSAAAGIQVYIEMKISLYDRGEPMQTNQLYFSMTDIDAAQSFKILNSDNLLGSNNMYAKSAEAIQPSDPSVNMKNMFVSSGNYIYSQGGESGNGFNIDTGADVYAKLKSETLKEGIDVVYGFATGAGSGIQFYAKQYKVSYISDKKGKITGITEENIISGQNPNGSSETPNKDYKLENWIANVDVTLTDGTIIKAGQPITPDQIKKVVVDKDVTFTAVHKTIPAIPAEPEVAVPNTGEMAGETNAVLVSVSIIGTLVGALLIRILPRLHHKKVSFKK